MDRNHYDKLSGEEKLAFLEKALEHLTIDEKAKLVKKLLPVKDDNSCTITMGNSQVHANTVYQFNLNSKDEIADLWGAIADRIRNNSDDKVE
ncbi:hypothetical protein PN497_11900 [Sphaerospermopsis kisseleviana CS-549]|uniref:Uncharacterized protein n=2 Tax=Sphaerospermopsis TaxID=752201 RepID=A0A479ZTC2_9CYAN|nr:MULTISPECIES: hypothetical protein [Sphaerospermopsis]MBD2135226.1 hypothetical protein [Sphaerospermopsis sp. FACHB-1094]MDB9442058.1 hypothetical protein [Sphaerospermopsis kisseleviana CS-549]BAZ83815.1 hypothetical protein NIES73_51040 [Sphaerospermopsis kisseleviana NIES-73]GCL35757.1 hypothetical protein SR1949_08550 [Sphaerospermopsis reniformis]